MSDDFAELELDPSRDFGFQDRKSAQQSRRIIAICSAVVLGTIIAATVTVMHAPPADCPKQTRRQVTLLMIENNELRNRDTSANYAIPPLTAMACPNFRLQLL